MAKIYIKQSVVVEKLDGLVCDACGAQTDPDGLMGMHTLAHSFGYGSPLDGRSVEADLCEDCLKILIEQAIPGARWQ